MNEQYSTRSGAGGIDVVINNAGIAALGVTEAFTLEQFQQMFDVNLHGIVRVNRAVLPAMRRQRSGLLIHVSSGIGRTVVPGSAPYAVSKFALEALADAYRFELTPLGMDSVIVEPGIHRTPILERILSPAEQDRVTEYRTVPEEIERARNVFVEASGAPDTPAPEGVVEAFVRLIDMPAGERPFRTVTTAPNQQPLEPYNAHAEQIRDTIERVFNATELTVFQPHASSNV